MDLPQAIQPCPVTINRTVAGRLFFASNPDEPQIVAPNGKTYGPGGLRTRLWLWPLTPDGRGVERPIVALDCPSRFGPTPGGSPWLADHPNGAVVRLADGRLHAVLCVRVAEIEETGSGGSSTPHSGCWIDEVIDDGPEMPVWRF